MTPQNSASFHSFDFGKLTSTVLNVSVKTRVNGLPWRGQFSPQLVEALIGSYSLKHGLILDPFVGSGTVLAEAARAGHDSVGFDINPAAITLARLYEFQSIPPETRLKMLTRSQMEFHSPLANAVIKASHLLGGLEKVRQLIERMPPEIRNTRVILADARAMPQADESVDLVVTSPPYLNVFNYHQQYRKAVEEIGWDVLRVAQSEIGSNRKNRSNRFLTVIQYCLDMGASLSEIHRVLKPEAAAIIVIGRTSNVRKTAFSNRDILKQLSTNGFAEEGCFERSFVNRFGQRIVEDILFLRRRELSASNVETMSRNVALAALKAAQPPANSRVDLENAIACLNSVVGSPLYEAEAEHKIAPMMIGQGPRFVTSPSILELFSGDD